MDRYFITFLVTANNYFEHSSCQKFHSISVIAVYNFSPSHQIFQERNFFRTDVNFPELTHDRVAAAGGSSINQPANGMETVSDLLRMCESAKKKKKKKEYDRSSYPIFGSFFANVIGIRGVVRKKVFSLTTRNYGLSGNYCVLN